MAPPGSRRIRRPTVGSVPCAAACHRSAYFSDAGEALVTAPRQLVCSRCHHAWVFTRMTCAGCGEQSGSRPPVFGDAERFPHLRIDACTSCDRYLVTVDLRKDPDAVPIVDELAAVPLDLYAESRASARSSRTSWGCEGGPTMAKTVGFFTDVTLCIGCKACEVACKEWNQLEGHAPKFRDSFDNTGQLDDQNWRHVRFVEGERPGKGVAWR